MTSATRPQSALVTIAVLSAIAVLTIATLLGWHHFGTDILLNAASAGLSWCF